MPNQLGRPGSGSAGSGGHRKEPYLNLSRQLGLYFVTFPSPLFIFHSLRPAVRLLSLSSRRLQASDSRGSAASGFHRNESVRSATGSEEVSVSLCSSDFLLFLVVVILSISGFFWLALETGTWTRSSRVRLISLVILECV